MITFVTRMSEGQRGKSHVLNVNRQKTFCGEEVNRQTFYYYVVNEDARDSAYEILSRNGRLCMECKELTGF